MRTVPLTAALTVACALAGCAKSKPEFEIAASGRAVSRGLAVTLKLPARSFTVGEQFEVVLIAENTTGEAIRIDARSASPYFLRVWRETSVGWEQVRRYPQVDLAVMSPWTLEAGARRQFAGVKLKVEPDWPRGEMLRITGELNSRPDARPAVLVIIEPRRGGPPRGGPAPQGSPEEASE